MTEKLSPSAYDECTFMANYGFHCGHGEGCRARSIKREYSRSNISLTEKERIRSHVETVAAQSGCPVYPLKPET